LIDFILKDLDESDFLEDFSSGDNNINSFLKNLALSNQKAKLSKTYVFEILIY